MYSGSLGQEFWANDGRGGQNASRAPTREKTSSHLDREGQDTSFPLYIDANAVPGSIQKYPGCNVSYPASMSAARTISNGAGCESLKFPQEAIDHGAIRVQDNLGGQTAQPPTCAVAYTRTK